VECPSCRRPNAADAVFCDECGARLEASCPACGDANRLGARFCKRCGSPLAPSPRPSPEPGSYTPAHLAQQILTSRSALEGERKQVTVLFADIRGSLELLDGRDPEEARKLLDPALHAMMEAVHRYEGTVNQVLGDGIMALFGAPLAHEDHAIRAGYAALAMQDAMRRYAEELRRTRGVELQARVGLNSGEVVVRAIGSDLRMDYSAVGQTTHLAARMEQLAAPGTIRLTAATARLAEGFLELAALGPIPVRGLAEPVEVFELTGAAGARTRLGVATARGLTRFVGRQREVERLGEALARAEAGHGQLVAIVGEPGVGKSRLIWEFTRSPGVRDWLVLAASAVSYGRATPYLPVVELLRGYFGLDARDDARAVREKITGRLLALDRALEPALPALLSLLDVPLADAAWQRLEPAERRRRTLEACRRLLLREGRVQPVVLVLEDLHWLDAESQTFLDSLVESLPAARLLLLVNYRPEYRHGWGGKGGYTQLRLEPLPPGSADALLEDLLGDDASLTELKPMLVARTEGNPFFLEESVRALAETEALAGSRGAYRRVAPLPNIQVPATVQAILAARIDRLAAEDKQLLQTAAVIGKDVPFALLAAIAELPEAALRGGLRALTAAEFLYEASLFPALEYSFTHVLTQDVAYQGLLQTRRQALHAAIVEAIETRDRLGEHVERLAHHAFHGQVWPKAVHYLRQAGTKATARSAYREAAACFDQALTALAQLPETPATVAEAIDVRLDLRSVLFALGEHERIFARLGEAEGLARALGDQPRLARIAAYATNYFLAVGDHRRALASGEEAITLATAVADAGLQTTTRSYLAQLHARLGDYRRAADLNRANVTALEEGPVAEGTGQSALLVLSRLWLVWCLAELGEFAEGREYGETAVQRAQATSEPLDLIVADLGLGLLFLRQGDLRLTIDVLERALGRCQSADLPVWFPAVASPLGYAYALAGRLPEALPLLEAAVAETTVRRGAGHALRIAHLGEACLLAGRITDARGFARRALALAREHEERAHEAYAHRLLGEVGAQTAPPDAEEAERAYRAAIAGAESLGMRPLAARSRLGLGRLAAAAGRRTEARVELTAAAAALRGLRMPFWLSQAEAALAMIEPER
jgi:class 3 adenylate cyclase/tetratricopeptide (TPR) repeat protein